MSVSISFPSGVGWFKANWVFRQLANDVMRRYSDEDIKQILDETQWVGGLDFTKMEPVLSSKLMTATRVVAQDTVDGRIEGWRPEDHHGHEMYCEALSELIAMIDQQNPPTTS